MEIMHACLEQQLYKLLYKLLVLLFKVFLGYLKYKCVIGNY